MPVKVRCQSCEKVFAAPDAARGKLVKCPGCEEKVKVPPGGTPKSGGPTKGAAKKPASKVQPEEHDHEHVLKNLDLDNIEDTETKVCPKCGQEIFEEDTIECPACGLNFETGLTKEKQRGIDPKLFYRVAFKDSWAFLTEYKSLALRTAMYSLVFGLLHFGCLFMITWCVNLPPRVFWILLAFVTGMVAPGWLWFLDTEIIKATMEKKEKMPRVNFDMFTCVALGIKYNLWRVAVRNDTLTPKSDGHSGDRDASAHGVADLPDAPASADSHDHAHHHSWLAGPHSIQGVEEVLRGMRLLAFDFVCRGTAVADSGGSLFGHRATGPDRALGEHGLQLSS